MMDRETLKRYAQMELSRRDFWEYCKFTSPDFYKMVNADYIIWPGEPKSLSPTERDALTKVKKYFVMCEGTVTIDLPYKE